jgi:hypothetical protein
MKNIFKILFVFFALQLAQALHANQHIQIGVDHLDPNMLDIENTTDTLDEDINFINVIPLANNLFKQNQIRLVEAYQQPNNNLVPDYFQSQAP